MGLILAGILINSESIYLLYTINYKKEKSIIRAIKKTIGMIVWIIYLIIYQKIMKNMVNIKKNEYDVHYVYHGQLYKIKCKNDLGPKRTQVLMIVNEKMEDVSSDIIPYMGPKYNFHKILYTPKDLNNKELSFYLSDGNILNFKEDSSIIIS